MLDVQFKLPGQGDGSALRVQAGALPGILRQILPEPDPTGVERLQQGQRIGQVCALLPSESEAQAPSS